MAPFTTACATEYPERSVSTVVPLAPGGSNDSIARYLADGLAKLWNKPVVVENRPGAGTAVGTAYVARANPDGHRLLFVSSSFASTAATSIDLPYDPLADFSPVGVAAETPNSVVASKSSGITSLAGLVAQAKTRKLFYGTSGVGSSQHIGAMLIADILGVDMEPVHYSGGSEAQVDLIGGRIDLVYGALSGAVAHIQNGLVQPVVVLGNQRSELLPDVPTMVEQGHSDGVSMLWYGVFAPAGTDQDVVSKINADMYTVMNAPEGKEFLKKYTAEPVKMSPDEFASLVDREIRQFKKLVGEIGDAGK